MQTVSQMFACGPTGHPVVARKTLPVPYAGRDPIVDDEARSSASDSSSSSSDSDSDSEMRDFIAPVAEPPTPTMADDSSSSSEDESDRLGSKRARSSPPPAQPKAKKAKIDRIAEDSKMIAPAPIVRFLQDHQTHKACGRCAECKKPPCGTCKACVQNQKCPKPSGSRDKRRCETLRCVKDKREQQQPALSVPGIPTEKDEISKELQKVSSQLAEVSALRGIPDFKPFVYDALVEKMRNLHDALAAIKSRKAKQQGKLPPCFHDAYCVVSELEKQRAKFAKFVVRSGGDCRTLADKRQMRDLLAEMIALWCAKRAENLTPPGESAEYEKLLRV